MTTKITQKITPFLWFDDKAEEVANFYTSIFKDSRLGEISRYDEKAARVSGRPKGSVMTVASSSRTGVRRSPASEAMAIERFFGLWNCSQSRSRANSRSRVCIVDKSSIESRFYFNPPFESTIARRSDPRCHIRSELGNRTAMVGDA
jgi:hypothetical protein